MLTPDNPNYRSELDVKPTSEERLVNYLQLHMLIRPSLHKTTSTTNVSYIK